MWRPWRSSTGYSPSLRRPSPDKAHAPFEARARRSGRFLRPHVLPASPGRRRTLLQKQMREWMPTWRSPPSTASGTSSVWILSSHTFSRGGAADAARNLNVCERHRLRFLHAPNMLEEDLTADFQSCRDDLRIIRDLGVAEEHCRQHRLIFSEDLFRIRPDDLA